MLSMLSRVALATSADLPQLDDDGPALQAALAALGVRSSPAVWDDPTIDWAAFDLVVIRSTWDYQLRHEAFLGWIDRVAEVTPVLNPPEVLRWNTDKRYLRDLSLAGVPVVETFWPDSPGGLPDLDDFVVKPAISASCQDTRRFQRADHAAAAGMVSDLQASGRTVMVQPYVEAIDTQGETALLYLDGRFSHAVRKGPMLAHGLPRAEDISGRTATQAERDVAERALDAVPGGRASLLYARVDLVPGGAGPALLELELTEPSLFLGFHPDAPADLAAAIARRLPRMTGIAARGRKGG